MIKDRMERYRLIAKHRIKKENKRIERHKRIVKNITEVRNQEMWNANKSIEEFQTRINVMQSTVNKMGDKLEEDSKET